MSHMIVGPECSECRRPILLPEIAVRLGGIAECPAGHRFGYNVRRYYRPDGEARPNIPRVMTDTPQGWAPVDLCRHEPEDMERYQTRVGTLRAATALGHE